MQPAHDFFSRLGFGKDYQREGEIEKNCIRRMHTENLLKYYVHCVCTRIWITLIWIVEIDRRNDFYIRR